MIRNQSIVSVYNDPFSRQKRVRVVVGVVVPVLIHCAVWIGLKPHQANVSVRHEPAMKLASSVMVYLLPPPSQSRDAPVLGSIRKKDPFPPSKHPAKRQREFADLKSEADTRITHTTTQEEDMQAITDTPRAETSTETPIRFNPDEIRALVQKDRERTGARFGQATGQQEQSLLAADTKQEAIKRAQRPKCDNDYKPKVGTVEFSGLMKLPFLVRGALSDKGCRW
jgi:hypothetical protein